jgi:hypothetical protein
MMRTRLCRSVLVTAVCHDTFIQRKRRGKMQPVAVTNHIDVTDCLKEKKHHNVTEKIGQHTIVDDGALFVIGRVQSMMDAALRWINL